MYSSLKTLSSSLPGLFLVCAFTGVLFRPIKPIKITKELDKDKESVYEFATSRNPTLTSLTSPGSVGNVYLLGPTNRDYPTAAKLILGSELSFGILSRTQSFLSMQPSSHGASLVTITMDMVQPLWDMASASQTSMRIVVGQDVQDVQSYFRRQRDTPRLWCSRKFCCCGRAEEHVGVRPLYR